MRACMHEGGWFSKHSWVTLRGFLCPLESFHPAQISCPILDLWSEIGPLSSEHGTHQQLSNIHQLWSSTRQQLNNVNLQLG